MNTSDMNTSIFVGIMGTFQKSPIISKKTPKMIGLLETLRG